MDRRIPRFMNLNCFRIQSKVVLECFYDFKSYTFYTANDKEYFINDSNFGNLKIKCNNQIFILADQKGLDCIQKPIFIFLKCFYALFKFEEDVVFK